MRLFLLGATGRTGRLVLQQALARGHVVTAIVRAASPLDTFNTHASRDLRIVAGNPLASEALAPHLPGHDVLISCLGQRSRRDATVLHQGAVAALDALARSGVRRYLVVSQGLLFHRRNPLIALLSLYWPATSPTRRLWSGWFSRAPLIGPLFVRRDWSKAQYRAATGQKLVPCRAAA
jgi:nucleoside-diphosphate-sugar epimerase